MFASTDSANLMTYLSTFYQLAANSFDLDKIYPLSSSPFAQKMQMIWDHGHQVRLHTSYRSFDLPNIVLEEKERLAHATEMEISTVRQYYIRDRTRDLWKSWDAAGFSTGSSDGFSNLEGFRCRA
ncbi:MAG: hypothetical protein FJZ98_02820 [Chloroflexi bacterium]|nr:hypothetical protein [Chloroflexota bacterium]